MIRKQYAPELKAEVLAYAAEHSAKAASEKFGVDQSSIYNWRIQDKKGKTVIRRPKMDRPEVHTIPIIATQEQRPQNNMVIVCNTGNLQDVLRSLNNV